MSKEIEIGCRVEVLHSPRPATHLKDPNRYEGFQSTVIAKVPRTTLPGGFGWALASVEVHPVSGRRLFATHILRRLDDFDPPAMDADTSEQIDDIFERAVRV